MTKILIIDDKADNLVSISALLKNLFPESSISTASNGLEGISKAKKEMPDTILLDVIMPGMDGYNVCKELKTDMQTKHIPIIMITAIKKDSESLIKGLEAGADNFLQKPIDAEELKAHIMVMLRIKNAEDNIREQKKFLENSVQESSERFYSLIETTSSGIIICDKSSHINLWNKGASNIFGYEADEILDKSILTIIPEKYRKDHNAGMQRFLETGKGKHMGKIIELEGIKKDGTIFPLELSLSNWKSGETTYVAAIIRDITDRKLAMNALSTANTIINRSPAVAFLWKNSEGWPVEFVSENAEKVLGYSSEDFLKSKVIYSDLIHPDDIEIVNEEVLSNSMDKNIKSFIHKPYRVISKDGNEIWIDDRTNIIRDDNDNITHYQGIVLNITKHIKTEKSLKDAQSILIQQEKMASLGGLAAGIAHEINNPLGFVMSNFRTLRKYADTVKDHLKSNETTIQEENLRELKDKKRKKIDFIMNDMDDLFKETIDGFERIESIVDNMRQFSRVDSENNKVITNLNDSIKNTLIIARNSYKYIADIETEFAYIPEIFCNTSEINQVFLNLIVNAAQAIEQKNLGKKGIIKIRTYVESDKVCSEIKDNGPGIPKKYLNKIFDPFFTTKEVGKGTGMGLSISYDIIVNKHNGELIVKSDKESGTTFTIKLPMNLNKKSIEE